MADIGENELEICGDQAELRRFRDRADARLAPLSERDPYNGGRPSRLCFHRLLPVPPAVAARDYGAPGGGGEWQKAHWGVKWGAANAALIEEEDSLIYSFGTAWYPPLPFLSAVSADYSALTFSLVFADAASGSREAFRFRGGEAVEGEG